MRTIMAATAELISTQRSSTNGFFSQLSQKTKFKVTERDSDDNITSSVRFEDEMDSYQPSTISRSFKSKNISSRGVGRSVSKKYLQAPNELARKLNNVILDDPVTSVVDSEPDGAFISYRATSFLIHDIHDNNNNSMDNSYEMKKSSSWLADETGIGLSIKSLNQEEIPVDGHGLVVNDDQIVSSDAKNLPGIYAENTILDNPIDISVNNSTEDVVLYDPNKISVKYQLAQNLTFADFTNIREIGSGMNGNVFTASYHGQTVAIKLIKKELENSKKVQREFDMEFDILSRLDHKNVIKVLGKGDSPRKFIVMEYLETILGNVLTKNVVKPSSIDSMFHTYTYSLLKLFQEAKALAEALAYLHEDVDDSCSIIHRGEIDR